MKKILFLLLTLHIFSVENHLKAGSVQELQMLAFNRSKIEEEREMQISFKKMMDSLLKNGYQVKPWWIIKVWSKKNTMLHILSYSNYHQWHQKNPLLTFEIAKTLLKEGADIDAKNEDGNTPLHLAILFGNTKLIKLYKENNARTDLLNNEQLTSLDFESILEALHSQDPNSKKRKRRE